VSRKETVPVGGADRLPETTALRVYLPGVPVAERVVVVALEPEDPTVRGSAGEALVAFVWVPRKTAL
jgi:hypothetical protein